MAELLSVNVLESDQPVREVQDYVAKRMPAVPRVLNLREWEQQTVQMREESIDRVLLTGRGSRWRTSTSKPEWADTLPGPGYNIRKGRFEVLPGMWVPVLLYEPAAGGGKHPGVLNFNGHDPAGKAAAHTQILCINLAKRGVSVLNVEWFGTGQLTQPGFEHGKLNQLDLLGTSGMTPFYLTMMRALDALLSLSDVDPENISAVGFDGGGWQALLLGAMERRIRFVTAVAGYGSLQTALKNVEDLRDAEYLPYDLCTVGDYLHFTMMVAPRHLMLIYNANDPVCFSSDRTLTPLGNYVEAFYNRCGVATNFYRFENSQSLEHTFDRVSRTRFYRVLRQVIGADQSRWPDGEIPCESELRKPEELTVSLPAPNETFHSLAMRLVAKVPLDEDVPRRASRLTRWQNERRTLLRDLVRAKDYSVQAESFRQAEVSDAKVVNWRMRFGAGWAAPRDWTLPLVELSRGSAKATAIVLADQGRASVIPQIERMASSGMRVLALDVTGFGEARFSTGGQQFPLLISALGDRPLGIQAGEVAAVARWAETNFVNGPVVVTSFGPRTSLIGLVAAGIEENAIGGLETHGGWTSLKQLIAEDWSVERAPEAFCPGLLEQFDVPQLEGLLRPRPVVLNPSK